MDSRDQSWALPPSYPTTPGQPRSLHDWGEWDRRQSFAPPDVPPEPSRKIPRNAYDGHTLPGQTSHLRLPTSQLESDVFRAVLIVAGAKRYLGGKYAVVAAVCAGIHCTWRNSADFFD